MSWVVARLPIEPGADEDDYVHTFIWLGKTPCNVEWTRHQTLAHRFADRNEASRLALCVDGSGRPRRIVPAISAAERVAAKEASEAMAWAEVRRLKRELRVGHVALVTACGGNEETASIFLGRARDADAKYVADQVARATGQVSDAQTAKGPQR